MTEVLHPFTLLGTQQKVLFNMIEYGYALPIAGGAAGAQIFPKGVTVPLLVNENISAVNEAAAVWFKHNGTALIGGARG